LITEDAVAPDDRTDHKKRIHNGLLVLSRINGAVLMAAMPLVLLDDLDQADLAATIRRFKISEFTDNPDHKHHVLLTPAQHDYLRGHMKSLEDLSRAIVALIRHVSGQIRQALSVLHDAWAKLPIVAEPKSGGVPMPTGCCWVDGMPHYVSSADCITLQGRWLDPCERKPPSEPKEKEDELLRDDC
jgi:hypothetical protein